MKKQKRKNKRNQNRPLGRGKSSRVVSLPVVRSKQVRNSNVLKKLVISHREFIKDVFAPDVVTNQVIEVNPGLKTTFPWLSNIANNFESYKFTKLWFEYIPNVGTSTDGALTMAPDYDPADDNSDVAKSTLFSFEDTIRTPLWKGCIMKCTPKNLHKMKTYYIRNSSLAGNLDIKTYDPLQFIMLVTGQTSATIGELWVHYTIHLETPQIEAVEPAAFALLGMNDTGVNEPFAGLGMNDAIGSLAQSYGVTVEHSDNLGFRKPGNYLVSLISQFIKDGGTGLPAVNIMQPGSLFKEDELLNATYEEVATDVFEYSETRLLSLDEEAEQYNVPWGVDLKWLGWTLGSVIPFAINYDLVITEIPKKLFDAWLITSPKTKLKGPIDKPFRLRNKKLNKNILKFRQKQNKSGKQVKSDSNYLLGAPVVQDTAKLL